MKKIFFILAFVFIGQQAFSQMYIVTISNPANHDFCEYEQGVLSIIEPNGTISYICFNSMGISSNSEILGVINQELNSIMNQGYKLVETNNGNGEVGYTANGLISQNRVNYGTTWYLALP